MTEITYDDVDLSEVVPEAIVQKITRSLLGSVRDAYQEISGRAGSWLFAEQPGDRTLTIALALVADNNADRRAAVRALAAWADKPTAAPLIVDDEAGWYWLAKLAESPDPDEWLEAAELELVFRTGPYGLAIDPSSDSWAATNNVDHTLTIDDEVPAFPIITITAGAAMASGFTLRVNGVDLIYGTAVANGAKVTVSSIAYAVTTGDNDDTELTGTFDPDLLSMAAVDGDFPILQPGDNTVRVIGANSTLDVLWRPRFR